MKKVLVILLSVSILGIYGCGNGTGTSESQVDSTLSPVAPVDEVSPVAPGPDSTLLDSTSNKVDGGKTH